MLSKADLNHAISLYLRQKFTQHAIMVDGEWGVGKTHLLTQEILPAIDSVGFFHISLYGLGSIQDIENEIYKSLSLTATGSEQPFPVHTHPATRFLPEAKLGGLSFAVQYLLQQLQADNGEDCTLVLCFDDLERWSGDFDICFSYINKITEHENIKCILLGNSSALDNAGKQCLSKAREKTIRHIYKFENPVGQRIDIAVSLVDYQSDANRQYLTNLIGENRNALIKFLNRIEEKNIRSLSEAFQLYEYILSHQQQVFRVSNRLPFTYLLTLLAALILFKKHFLHDDIRGNLTQGMVHDENGLKLLKAIGYFETKAPEHITRQSRLLLDAIFYRLDEISLTGIFSIIENGLYLAEDFSGDFDRWSGEAVYEAYLDKYAFYQLDDASGKALISSVIDLVFEEKSITNPATLLLIAERLSDDISKGVVDEDLDDFEERFKGMVESLYESMTMEVMDLQYLRGQYRRYIKCRDIFFLILELNQHYIVKHQQQNRQCFWKKIAMNPDQIPRIISKVSDKSFVTDVTHPDEVAQSLESLSNADLLVLSQELIDKRAELSDGWMPGTESKQLQGITERLYRRYESHRGVRSANIRELASIIASF
jgi:hypothetical protein